MCTFVFACENCEWKTNEKLKNIVYTHILLIHIIIIHTDKGKDFLYSPILNMNMNVI